MSPKTKTLIALFVSLLLFSCFPKKIPPQERTAQAILGKLCSQEKKLHSLAVLISFKAKDRKENMSSNMELFWAEPDSFVFYFKSVLGTTTAYGRLIGDSLEMYITGENRYYKGSLSGLGEDRFVTENLSELLNWTVGRYGFGNENPKSLYPEKDKIIYEFENQKRSLKLWVDPGKLQVEKGVFSIKDSPASYELSFKGYFRSKGFSFPRLIEIAGPSKDEFVKLKFIERKVNYSVPSSKFKFKIPKNAVQTDSL